MPRKAKKIENDEKVENSQSKMLYVGKGKYNPSKFAKEAEKYGVSRSISWIQLAMLEFGECVELAQYKSNKEINDELGLEGDEKKPVLDERSRKIGNAEIFGFFRISGLNLDNITSDLLMNKLKHESNVHINLDPDTIERECGTMVISAVITLDPKTTLKEIYEAILEIHSESDHKIKCFLTGAFYPYEEKMILENQRFSRTLYNVDIPKRFEEVKKRSINVIRTYEKKEYEKKNGEQITTSFEY